MALVLDNPLDPLDNPLDPTPAVESTKALEASQDDPADKAHPLNSTGDFHPLNDSAQLNINSSAQLNSSARQQEQKEQKQQEQKQQGQQPEPETLNLPVSLATYGQQAKDYAKQARSHNTRRAYASDWDDFARWCQPYGFVPLPAKPETVALYLTALADALKPSTLGRRLATISQVHQTAGHDTPTTAATVRLVWARHPPRQRNTAARQSSGHYCRDRTHG